MVMRDLATSSARRLGTVCSLARALSTTSPSSRFSISDEDGSNGQSSVRLHNSSDENHNSSRPSMTGKDESHDLSSGRSSRLLHLVENHNHRLSQPLRALPQNSAQPDSFSYWPSPPSSSSSSSSSSFCVSDDENIHRQSRVLRPQPATNTISVFWDLDNKPPHSVPPYEAAIRLREVACSFGRLVDMVAYANRHAFSYLPSWVKEERRNRKELDKLEMSGLVVPGEPYVCGYCGRRCKTNVALRKHFKQLHEREKNKRLSRLDCLKGKKKEKYKQSLIGKETKYREASQGIITPKVGYGLMQELKRAGVWVKMVSDRPQAADEALMRHISQSINMGIKCICLVSDDSDFLPVLHEAKAQHLHTVVVGDRPRLKMFADIQFSWSDLASGSAFDKATELASMWYGKGGKSDYGLRMQSCLRERATTVESKYFPVRTHKFKEWDVSDQSDMDSSDVRTHNSIGLDVSDQSDMESSDVQTYTFKEWNVSDQSDMESSDQSEAVEGSSDAWVIEDDESDNLDVDEDNDKSS